MSDVKQVRTACRQCHGGCGVIAHVQDGKVIKVEGDPDSPISNGTLCSKGLAVTQLAYNPDRILHPMRQTARGWQRITWDDALDTIAEKFKAVIDEHGPESIVIGQGTGRDYESHLYRFANQLGTPNVLTAGHMCYVSRVASTLVTVGNLPICDYEGGPGCIVLWGCNPQWTNPDEYKGEGFWRAYRRGAKLICIDPRKGFTAKKADLCIGCRECMDACPFGAMQFDDDQETAVKCDLCVERLNDNKAPACYSVCPTRCISWGETKKLADRVAREALPQRMK